MDFKKSYDLVNQEWDNTILQTLSDYIKVPNQSPLFDPEVLTNGYQDEAIKIVMDWVTAQVCTHFSLKSNSMAMYHFITLSF